MTLFLDLDGPILDVSRRYYRVHQLCRGADPPAKLGPAEFWELKRARVTMGEVLARDGVSPGEAPDYAARWRELIEAPAHLLLDQPWPGVHALLAAWRPLHQLVLVTLRQRPEALRDQLHRLQLAPLFHEILQASPEHPEGWREKERLLRGSPRFAAGACVIGDTEIDIRAGKLAGLRTVGVLNGIRRRGLLEAENPDYLVEDLGGLSQVLEWTAAPQPETAALSGNGVPPSGGLRTRTPEGETPDQVLPGHSQGG